VLQSTYSVIFVLESVKIKRGLYGESEKGTTPGTVGCDRSRTVVHAVSGIIIYASQSFSQVAKSGIHDLAHRFLQVLRRYSCAPCAIRLLPVSTALVIFYSFPAFTAIFSFLIYRERIGKLEITCIAVVVIGIGVLFDFQLAGGLFGQTMALVGGAFAGLTVTLIRTLREKNGPVIIYLYFCTMGALVTFPKFVMNPILPSTPVEWVMILGIVFASVAAQLLMNQGFFYCSGWEGGVFMSSEVIFTSIVGIAFLGDPASWRFWTGGLMIFGSVVALNRLKANGGKPHKP